MSLQSGDIERFLRKHWRPGETTRVVVKVYTEDEDSPRQAGEVNPAGHTIVVTAATDDDEHRLEYDFTAMARECVKVAQDDAPDAHKVRVLMFAKSAMYKSMVFPGFDLGSSPGSSRGDVNAALVSALLTQHDRMGQSLDQSLGHMGQLAAGFLGMVNALAQKDIELGQAQKALVLAEEQGRSLEERGMDLAEEVVRLKMGMGRSPSSSSSSSEGTPSSEGEAGVASSIASWLRSMPADQRAAALNGLRSNPEILEAFGS